MNSYSDDPLDFITASRDRSSPTHRNCFGISLFEVLVASFLILSLLGIVYQVFRHFSLSRTIHSAQIAFHARCSTLAAQMKQDLVSIRSFSVSSATIDLERFSGVIPGGGIKTQRVKYRFESSRVSVEREGVIHTTDFDDLLVAVGGALKIELGTDTVRVEGESRETSPTTGRMCPISQDGAVLEGTSPTTGRMCPISQDGAVLEGTCFKLIITVSGKDRKTPHEMIFQETFSVNVQKETPFPIAASQSQ